MIQSLFASRNRSVKIGCSIVTAAIFAASSLRAAPATEGDWSKIRLYGHAFSEYRFSPDQLNTIKDNFAIFTIEKRHAYRQKAFGRTSTEQASVWEAGQILQKNPQAKVLFYWNAELEYKEHYETLQSRLKDFMLTDRLFNRLSFNFDIAGARNVWMDGVSNNLDKYNGNRYAGAFIDALPKVVSGDKKRGVSATNNTAFIKDSMKELSERRKGNLIIYNGYRVRTRKANNVLLSTPELQAGADIMKNAKGVFVEGFMSYDFSKDSAALQMDALIDIPKDKYIVVRGTPDGYGSKGKVDFSLACYLILANDNSFYSYLPNKAANKPSAYDATTALYIDDLYGINLGKPTSGVIKRGKYEYLRRFENVTVRVNFETQWTNLNKNWANRFK